MEAGWRITGRGDPEPALAAAAGSELHFQSYSQQFFFRAQGRDRSKREERLGGGTFPCIQWATNWMCDNARGPTLEGHQSPGSRVINSNRGSLLCTSGKVSSGGTGRAGVSRLFFFFFVIFFY